MNTALTAPCRPLNSQWQPAFRILSLALLLSAAAGAENWPGWRGNGSGVSQEGNLPVYWSATDGVAWKTVLPGEGNSSPIIWGDRVYLTASTAAGKKRVVLALDRDDGHIVWQTELPAGRTPKTYVKNGYASPTPATDGDRIYAFFDSPGLVALDLDGKLLWTRDLGPFKNSYNMASSPVLCGDTVIQCCDQDQGSFIVALDKATGEERWHKARPGMSRQFATPLVISVEDRAQVVVNGKTVIAYDPSNGQEIWTCRGMKANLTPSPVTADGLIYVTSGRNGPSMAIDPRGSGDVTNTRVIMQVATGGPYVPSPLGHASGLILPADDGMLRLIGQDGKLACEFRLPGHYTGSPVAGGEVIYWPNEKGEVAVVRVTAGAQAPLFELVAVNPLGEKCLASPAIAEGHLFFRTATSLLCIAGTEKPSPTVKAELPTTFAELKKLFAEHPAAEGEDVALRIEIVEKLATLKDGESVPFLLEAAHKDAHWDVSEAAAKALAGMGQPALPALITLANGVDWRPYLKIIGANGLGKLAAAEGISPLLKSAGDGDALVRVACVEALGRTALVNVAEAGKIMPVLMAGLDDREGTVRKAAIEALALNADSIQTGLEGDNVVKKLLDCMADNNRLVSDAARAALKEKFKVAPETINASSMLYGEPRKAPLVRWLRAGPVEMKFQDGELRYLRVGDREIVRRIYFAVRDEHWDTVMPDFREISVKEAADSFSIKLAAVSRNDVAEFSWTGTITGTAEGTITFQVGGQADRDFKPPRIGLNVLYGTGALAGQAYELVDETEKVTPGEFPRLVSAKLLSDNFRTLRYATADGIQVSVGLTDGKFGMEDQRNFGDTSYKAFSAMPFKFMDIKKGEKGAQTLVLAVTGAKTVADPAKPVLRVTLGTPLPGAKLPKWLEVPGKTASFGEINGNPAKYADAKELAWSFNVALHMPDDDTFIENQPTIVDQVKSVRAFAPESKIRIEPVTFNSPYPRPGPDPRNHGLFGVAWTTRMMKYLGLAGVGEVRFDVGAGAAGAVHVGVGASAAAGQELAKLAGSQLLATTFEGRRLPAMVDVLAVETGGKRQVWCINLTDQPQAMILAGLGDGVSVRVQRGATLGSEPAKPQTAPATKGEMALDLKPFEVCHLIVAKAK